MRTQFNDCVRSKELRRIEKETAKRAGVGQKPAWIGKTYWSVEEGHETHYFAVGMTQRVLDRYLARTVSQDRARAELVKVLDASKMTIKETQNGRTITTEASMAGHAPINIDNYYDHDDKTTYALVCLSR